MRFNRKTSLFINVKFLSNYLKNRMIIFDIVTYDKK